MKKNIILLFCLSIGVMISCQNQKKSTNPQKTVEVKVERNDTFSKATVTISSDLNGKVSKEVQVFEGAHEEVMSKVDLITEESEGNEIIERKSVKKIKINNF